MDSKDTWPSPVAVGHRDFDRRVMRELGQQPSASRPDSPPDSPNGTGHHGAEASDEPHVVAGTSGAVAGAASGRIRTREKLANSLLLLLPLGSALLVVLCWMRYTATGHGAWLGAIAAVLVVAAIAWLAVAKKALARAQGHLAARLPGVVGYGVGIVREADVGSPFDANGVSDTVDARLVLSVNPVQGPSFQATVEAAYRASDADRLVVGTHGPVRYLRSDPENTVGIETRLDAATVQQIYRGAAMN